MKTLHFVTQNPGKFESTKNVLGKLTKDIDIEQLDYDYPEDKSDNSVKTVALNGAKHCADKFNKEVITSDVGIFIEALEGFPGINTAVNLKAIGIKGIMDMMKEETNRVVYWKAAIGYCKPGQEPVAFEAQVKGTIPEQPRGEGGFGWDSIFIPEGYNITQAEDPTLRDKNSPLIPCLKQLIEFIK